MNPLTAFFGMIAVVSSAAAVFLFAREGYLPLWRRVLTGAEKDARKFEAWTAELFVGWSPEQARRAAIAVRITVGSAALLVLVITRSPVFAAAAALAVFVAPAALYRWAREKRAKRFEEQLPDAVTMMVASVRAGNALSHAIEEVARKAPAPVGEEFAQVAREHGSGGLSVEDALARARERLKIESFTMISSALIINSGQGGDLLHILERMADATRSLSRLQKKIVTETSEVRAQQKVILVMTPLFGGLVCLFDSSIPHILFHTVLGNVLLVIVGIIQVGCIAWIRGILRTTI